MSQTKCLEKGHLSFYAVITIEIEVQVLYKHLSGCLVNCLWNFSVSFTLICSLQTNIVTTTNLINTKVQFDNKILDQSHLINVLSYL